MKHSSHLALLLATALPAAAFAYEPTAAERAHPEPLPLTPGKFQPTWESLETYQTPEWFRDAKFGLWAHWGPQCEPEQGDWFGKRMYSQYNGQNKDGTKRINPLYDWTVKNYGPLTEGFGFKDIINTWHAENWDPARLMKLYKRAGAQYFVGMANHHDNFDLWDSTYQPWNSVALGPKKNLIRGWEKAARAEGLRFGVSVHAAHAWMWYEPAQGSDQDGPNAGKPYDGKLTAADGKGKWWDGLDPQDLYAQNHPLGKSGWDWKAAPKAGEPRDPGFPSDPHMTKFYNRTVDLIAKYKPDLVYFDDTALPFYPWSDIGLKIAADYYNRSAAQNGGRVEGVINGKKLTELQKKAIVLDIERGKSNAILPQPWQTDTCIGQWHYNRSIYDRKGYKKSREVLQTLADIVSKNGNLLLSVPVRADGTLDEQETAFLEEIAAWMDVNAESIFATRPWRVSGEGPALEVNTQVELGNGQVEEKKAAPLGPQDIRFTTSKDGKTLYALFMDWPGDNATVTIKSITAADRVTAVAMLGNIDKIESKQEADGLSVTLPAQRPSAGPVALKLTLAH